MKCGLIQTYLHRIFFQPTGFGLNPIIETLGVSSWEDGAKIKTNYLIHKANTTH